MNMNVCDSSPVEPLAVNYLHINNLLTCVAAVITAAVSLWCRITSTATVSVKIEQSQNALTTLPSAIEIEPAIASVSTRPLNNDGVTKGRKFTVYYDEDENKSGNGESTLVVRKWGYDFDGNGEGDWSGWECDLVRMRSGDLGWYRCQSLTAINGNVVRLWGETSRRTVRV